MISESHFANESCLDIDSIINTTHSIYFSDSQIDIFHIWLKKPPSRNFQAQNAELGWFLNLLGDQIGHGDLSDENKWQTWNLRHRKPPSGKF